jgi:hypothetical protein
MHVRAIFSFEDPCRVDDDQIFNGSSIPSRSINRHPTILIFHDNTQYEWWQG